MTTQHFAYPPYEIRNIQVGQLTGPVDNGLVPYQRNQGVNGRAPIGITARIRKYGDYDPRILRSREISERPDGTLACMDGNGSNHWLEKMFGYDYLVPCKVYHGLTIQEEAALFRGFQRIKQVTRTEEFRAGQVEESTRFLDIARLVTAAGFEVGNGRKPGVLTPSGVEYAYDMGGTRRLQRVLDVLNKTFSGDIKRTNTGFVMALTDLLGNEDLDERALDEVLNSVDVDTLIENRAGATAKKHIYNNVISLYTEAHPR